MTEESDREALLRAVVAKIAAKEAAKNSGGATLPDKPETQCVLPPELRILAQRRARFDNGDRSVRREVFGRREQEIADGADFDPF